MGPQWGPSLGPDYSCSGLGEEGEYIPGGGDVLHHRLLLHRGAGEANPKLRPQFLEDIAWRCAADEGSCCGRGSSAASAP